MNIFRTTGFTALAALVPLGMALTAVPAHADNVQNNVSSGAAGATITNPNGSATVDYSIQAVGGDGGPSGKDGNCNASDGSAATVSIVAPVGVTATPPSLTFTDCDTVKPVVFTATTDGTYPISASVSDTGVGTYTVGQADFNLLVQTAAQGDATAPVITSALNPATPSGTNGWYTEDVSVAWTVTEAESPASLVKTGCADQTVTEDQLPTAYTCSAISAGGTASESVSIKRDATAPTDVTFVGGPADGARYFPSTVPAAPTCTAADATSGIATCVVTGYSNALGTHTLTATATDNAGNVATATSSYVVRLLTATGFYSPVDLGGVLNTVKGGSTVPLKFEVLDEGVELTDKAVVTSMTFGAISCSTSAATDAIEHTVDTGATALRYDGFAGQFIQNWKTPTRAGSCYRVTMTTQGGTTISALFKIK